MDITVEIVISTSACILPISGEQDPLYVTIVYSSLKCIRLTLYRSTINTQSNLKYIGFGMQTKIFQKNITNILDNNFSIASRDLGRKTEKYSAFA